jgi:NitT/TauT family transport system permease protein
VPSSVRRGLLPLAGFAIFIGAWWLLAVSGLMGEGQIPPPGDVLSTIVNGFSQDGLLLDVRLSVLRVLIGVAIGSLVAIPVGFVLAWYGILREMFDPLVSFFRALPPIALIPLVIVYLGIGENARISILVYAAFFASVIVIYEGVSAIDDIYVRAARSMGASELELFRRVVVPLTIPQVLVAVRVAPGRPSWRRS